MKTITIQNTIDFSGTIIIPIFETTNENVTYNDISIVANLFNGKKDTHYIADKNGSTFIFVGLGKTTDYKTLKTIFRRISAKQKDFLVKKVALVIPEVFNNENVEATISGLYVGTYNLGHFKKEKKIHPFLEPDFKLELVSSNENIENIAQKAMKIAHAQLEVLKLVDLPPNVATPTYMGNWAKESGEKYGFATQIIGKKEAKKLGLHAFLSVAKGSKEEPQFVIMNYVPENPNSETKHVGLVGKGITFDTGGLNIKTAGMVHMKCDMAGGAAVLGAMQLISHLKLPVKVTAIVPFAENSVDKNAFLPSDVIQSYSGHSIEIIDTDAEGRLILADGLSYLICNFNPDIIIDIATLTGSSVGTFGYECGALFTNNKSISENIQKAGDAVGERLWPLPLWDAYKSDIDSDIADVKNYSGKPVAGAISAAKFLEFFTNEHKAWAHLDIAGVAFGDDEFAKSKHATAYGVHLLTKFIETL